AKQRYAPPAPSGDLFVELAQRGKARHGRCNTFGNAPRLHGQGWRALGVEMRKIGNGADGWR
ncbi:hypothetical protein SE17_17215, partial [Kouleothrix aurantiaca]